MPHSTPRGVSRVLHSHDNEGSARHVVFSPAVASLQLLHRTERVCKMASNSKNNAVLLACLHSPPERQAWCP